MYLNIPYDKYRRKIFLELRPVRLHWNGCAGVTVAAAAL